MDTCGAPWEAQCSDDGEELCDGRVGAHVPVHLQLGSVVGFTQVGDSERDPPR